jgi:hypothetical protein
VATADGCGGGIVIESGAVIEPGTRAAEEER